MRSRGFVHASQCVGFQRQSPVRQPTRPPTPEHQGNALTASRILHVVRAPTPSQTPIADSPRLSIVFPVPPDGGPVASAVREEAPWLTDRVGVCARPGGATRGRLHFSARRSRQPAMARVEWTLRRRGAPGASAARLLHSRVRARVPDRTSGRSPRPYAWTRGTGALRVAVRVAERPSRLAPVLKARMGPRSRQSGSSLRARSRAAPCRALAGPAPSRVRAPPGRASWRAQRSAEPSG